MVTKVIQLKENEVLAFACDEIRSVVNEVATGVGCVYVGTWDDVRANESLREGLNTLLDEMPQTVSDDAYVILPSGNDIVLAGKSERATLFAVYHYLERQQGLYAVYPDEWSNGPIKPILRGSLEQPRFKRRGFVLENYNNSRYIVSLIDWLAKNRVSEIFFTFQLWEKVKADVEPEIRKRGLLLALGGHAMTFFLEQKQNEPITQENPYHAKSQMDFKDESWKASFLAQVASYCKDTPVLTRVSLWPEDVAVQQKTYTDRNETFLAHYIQFTEQLQNELNKVGCHVAVEHIAYNAGLSWEMMELKDEPVSHHVETLYAYWGRDYNESLMHQPGSDEHRAYQSLQDWREKTSAAPTGLTVFEYYSDHYMLSFLFPILAKRIAADLDDYEKMQMDGVLNLIVPYVPKSTLEVPSHDVGYDWHWAHGCNSFFYARMTWGDSFEQAMEAYLYAFPESIRAVVSSWLAAIEERVAPLTGWNVPLFPARVVDPERGDIPTDQQRLFEQLQAIQHLSSLLENTEPTSSAIVKKMMTYMQGLIKGAQQIENEWKMKRLK